MFWHKENIILPSVTPPSSTTDNQALKAILKGALLFISLVILIFALYYFDLAGVLDADWFQEYIRGNGIFGVLIFIATAALLSCISVPRQIIGFCAGYLFGAGFGTLYATIGTTLGCILGFYYARYLGSSFFKRIVGSKVDPVNRMLKNDPFSATLLIRLLPVGHNATTNILAGLSKVPLFPFVAGSFVGYIPQSLIFALLGSGLEVSIFTRSFLAALLFIASGLLGYMLYHKYHRV